jgi:hypothetical protein
VHGGRFNTTSDLANSTGCDHKLQNQLCGCSGPAGAQPPSFNGQNSTQITNKWSVPQTPLIKTPIFHYKSVYYTGKGNDLNNFRAAINQVPTVGYCEAIRNDFKSPSNAEYCTGITKGNVSTSDIAMYTRVTFGLMSDGVKFSFALIQDCSRGGALFIDGKLMSQADAVTKTGMADQASPKPLTVTNVKLASGNHVIEQYCSIAKESAGDAGKGMFAFRIDNVGMSTDQTAVGGKWYPFLGTFLGAMANPIYEKAQIVAKTFPYGDNPVATFSAFQQAIQKPASSGVGYCTKTLEKGVVAWNNQVMCGAKVTGNIGWYYMVKFPVHYANMAFEFRIQGDFDQGAFILLQSPPAGTKP